MIHCIIIEDEPLAQEVLENYIAQTENLKLVGKFSSAIAAFSCINTQKVDLMFLDIKMPLLNGMQFIEALKKPPAFIFTTAFSQYAQESYELDAIDYLLKPITYERFFKAVLKYQQLKPTITALEENNFTYFKVNGKLEKIEHKDLLYAKSLKDYIKIFTTNGMIVTHLTMKALESILPITVFKRVHRSYIINTLHINSIGKNEISVYNNKIPIGQSYKVIFSKLAGN